MKNKVFALVTFCAVVLSAVGFASAQNVKNTKNANQLLPLLPASDFAATINTKRLVNDALPQILSANQPLLAEITEKFDKIKNVSGIDLKQFEQVAIGVNMVKAADNKFNFEPLILARGQYSAAGLIAIAKIAAKGKFREEKIGDRSIYVFSAKEMVEQNKGKITNPVFGKMIDKFLSGLSDEIALTTYDENTLTIGSLARLRESLEGKSRISDEILGLISRRPNAIISFGGKVPNGLSQFIALDNDELGKNLDAVRSVSGSMDVVEGSTAVAFSAKTVNSEQAKGLKDTLDGLQILGKALLGGSKSPDKKIYGKMIENAKIAQIGNEITLDLIVPQSDLNVIVGAKK